MTELLGLSKIYKQTAIATTKKISSTIIKIPQDLPCEIFYTIFIVVKFKIFYSAPSVCPLLIA